VKSLQSSASPFFIFSPARRSGAPSAKSAAGEETDDFVCPADFHPVFHVNSVIIAFCAHIADPFR
jgi:hypothetical protein